MASTEAGETTAGLRPLRRNWRFQLLWGGSAASLLGSRMSTTAYPLLLLAMTGSTFAAGAFSGVQLLTQVLFGIHAGTVADRYDRRVILIVADGLRFLASLTVPLALAMDRLTLTHILLVAVVVGGTMAYAFPVRTLAIRSVVPKAQLRQALAQDGLRTNGTGLLGPPLAGFLFGLGRPAPFIGAAVGSLLSFGAACAVPFDGKPQTSGGKARGGALEGMRFLARSPLLRATVGITFALYLVCSATVLSCLVLLQREGVGSAGTGLALSGEAVGGIVGVLFVSRLHRLMGPGKLLIAASWLYVPPLLVLPLSSSSPVLVFFVLTVMLLSDPALDVMTDVLIFQQVPDELRGRVMAATFMLFTLGMPAGTLGSGLLLDFLSPDAVFTVLAVALAVALVPVTLNRTLWGSGWPT
ncbi:MFS transporter [Streptomyces milbemycinicus]|uniref:MFS transporter n=1 Tax=Streptomyces milbemycinicus TaxID=476552 RepID=A0ABW8LW52_9ACTN